MSALLAKKIIYTWLGAASQYPPQQHNQELKQETKDMSMTKQHEDSAPCNPDVILLFCCCLDLSDYMSVSGIYL